MQVGAISAVGATSSLMRFALPRNKQSAVRFAHLIIAHRRGELNVARVVVEAVESSFVGDRR